MAYEWKDGEVITAEKLNSTGGGVLIITSTEDDEHQYDILDKTFAEIKEAFLSGINCLVHMDHSISSEWYSVSYIDIMDDSSTVQYDVNFGSNYRYTTTNENGYPTNNWN